MGHLNATLLINLQIDTFDKNILFGFAGTANIQQVKALVHNVFLLLSAVDSI